jgi:hypothetical protein
MVFRARDRSQPVADRVAALKGVLLHDPTRGKGVLIEVASDESERDDMLEAVGDLLGRMCWAGLVSEFDTRNMTERAGEVFFAWQPDVGAG